MNSSRRSKFPFHTSATTTAFHGMAAIVSAINIYAFIYGLAMESIPSDLLELVDKHIRINPLKYITFWNMVLQSLYFSLTLLTDLCNQNRLLYIRDLLFACWLLPVGTWVCSSFWVLYWMYSELILPKRMALLMPSWVNHGIHTLPAVFSIMELYLLPHKYPTRRTGLFCNIALFVAYFLYMASTSVMSGMWPYPFLTELSPLHVSSIMVTLAASAVLQYITGEKLNMILWGNIIRKKL